MHITTKDVIGDEKAAKELGVDVGTHILTSTLDGDGAVALVSLEGKLEAKVISVQRTDSGGIKVQTAVTVTEPKPVAPPEPEKPIIPLTLEEEASAYLQEKGLAQADADAAVAKYGAVNVLIRRTKERDAELSALLSPKKAPAVQ